MEDRAAKETQALYVTRQVALRAAAQGDPFLLQARRELEAACPKIAKIEDSTSEGALVLVVSVREPTLEDIDRLCELQWDLMDRYPERTLHIEIRDAAA